MFAPHHLQGIWPQPGLSLSNVIFLLYGIQLQVLLGIVGENIPLPRDAGELTTIEGGGGGNPPPPWTPPPTRISLSQKTKFMNEKTK